MTAPATIDTYAQLAWLAEQGAKFALPYGRSKNQFETDWPNKPHSLEEAIAHAKNGGNDGILTGKHSAGIVALDRDIAFWATVDYLGPLANTTKILRDNASGRGKLLYRVRGELPPNRVWKENPEDKHPAAEMLSTGRHALAPPSECEGGRYTLHDQHLGILEVTLEELDHAWWLITGEHLEERQPTREENMDYTRRVKDAYKTIDIFKRFDFHTNGDAEEKGEIRLLGNGGLLINDWRWYCHADGSGGDQIDAWYYCKTKHKLDHKDTKAFWETVHEMGDAAGISRPAAKQASYTNGTGETHTPGVGAATYPHNDYGNGLRLIDQCGDSLIYVEGLSWYAWEGKRWRADIEGLLASRLARGIAHNLYEQAWHTQDKELSKWALRSGDQARIARALNSAKTDSRILRYAEDLDADLWALNCANGTLDLLTLTLRPHNRRDLITKITPVPYDLAATCPTWLSHLEKVFGGDKDVIELYRIFCGMALSGDVSQEAWLFAQGVGGNGKTVTLKTIHKMMGEYAIALSSEVLLVKRGGSEPYELADLRGVRAAFAYELPEGRFNAARIKRLASNEPFTARQIFTRQTTFRPTHTLFVAGNAKPSVTDTSDGFWRRMNRIPFEHRFEGDGKDIHFADKLEAELPGILAWAAGGCQTWLKTGLPVVASVEKATNEYKTDSNVVARFISEQCILVKDDNIKTSVERLYEAYKSWCMAEGEAPDSNRSFGMQFSQLAPTTTVKVSNSKRYRHGVTLAVEAPLPTLAGEGAE